MDVTLQGDIQRSFSLQSDQSTCCVVNQFTYFRDMKNSSNNVFKKRHLSDICDEKVTKLRYVKLQGKHMMLLHRINKGDTIS